MIDVPKYEQGVTRLFSLSMPDADAKALRDDPSKQAAALGIADVNATGIEVFRVSDLGEIGLAGYLAEGADVPTSVIDRDRIKLAALGGWVMMAHSSAFPDSGATLTPQPELTLIGTYAQTEEQRPEVALQAEAAEPYTGAPVATQPAPRKNSAGSLAIVALIALAALLILWLLV